MAEEVRIGGGPATAKVRNPVGVAVLILITLGIYGLYWWYQVNREMVDLGKALNADGLGDNPTISLLAWFPGGLVIVPAIVSLYNGVHRMKRAQELTTGRHPTLNGWIVLILFVFVLHIVAYGYMQAELNKAWQAQSSGDLPTGAPTTTPATPTPESGSTGSTS
jgi:hypothetical protein